MQRIGAIVFVLLCFTASAATLRTAEPHAVAFTEPEEAGIDYKLQGEYVGELSADEGKESRCSSRRAGGQEV